MFIHPKNLAEIFSLIEEAKMKTYSLLIPTNEIENLNTDQYEFIANMVKTEVKEEYIKITINDVLPPNVGLSKNDIKFYWLSLMNYAFKGIETKYTNLLCIIRIFSPAPYWDVENRAIKVVIDSLRYNQLIPDDRSEFLKCLLVGETDRKNPRTEIFLREYPQDELWFLNA